MAQLLQDYLKNHTAYITCAGRVDGAGAQANAVISVMVAAKYLGFKYIHSPMTQIAHNDSGVKRDKWVSQWEEFFNFGARETSREDFLKKCPGAKVNQTTMEILEKCPEKSAILGVNGIYGVHKNTRFNGIHINIVKKAHDLTQKYMKCDPILKQCFREIIDDLRIKYNETPKPNLLFYSEPNVLNIAIHVRRGDVAKGNTIIFENRFKSNGYYYALIRRFDEIYCDTPHVFHIFSEGCLREDFPELIWSSEKSVYGRYANFKENPLDKNKLKVHLNGDPMSAFHHLVSAHVVVIAKSCFSFVAGLLNTYGKIIYTPFWYEPLNDNWVNGEQLLSF